MANVSIRSSELMKYVTLDVVVVGEPFGRLRWRRHIAVALLRLAACLLSVEIQLRYRPADQPMKAG
jgi:hypothetical protein